MNFETKLINKAFDDCHGLRGLTLAALHENDTSKMDTIKTILQERTGLRPLIIEKYINDLCKN